MDGLGSEAVGAVGVFGATGVFTGRVLVAGVVGGGGGGGGGGDGGGGGLGLGGEQARMQTRESGPSCSVV